MKGTTMPSTELLKAAIIRALRTFAQVAIVGIGTATQVEGVDWVTVVSMAGLAAILSILTSVVTDLPEA
jgi:hypothetical protein